MKVLILGATGMAGHTISLYFKEIGYSVTALSRSVFEYCDNIISDAADFEFLAKVIKEGEFHAIINAIGSLNEDAERNKSRAILLNSYLPHWLNQITEKMQTRIIHMSTDCVFSGKKGSYNEKEFKDGETFYARTKAMGELENNKDLTFRTSIIGPDMKITGIGLLNWFMKQEKKINGFKFAMWTGVTTLTLAKAMVVALEENITGLYNLVNKEGISKFHLLELLNRHMKNNKLVIVPDNKFVTDKTLINNRSDFSFMVPSYEDMIIEMKVWVERYSTLYGHYFPDKNNETKTIGF